MDEKLKYIIRDGYENMDFDRVREMLNKSHWCPGIKKSEIIKGAKNSALLVGAFSYDNLQIGFSRAISDKTRFAYILDVIVDERFRRQSIGQAMVNHMLNHRELMEVYQWVLITKDAHGVYKKCGFKIISRPDDWMEIWHARPER